MNCESPRINNYAIPYNMWSIKIWNLKTSAKSNKTRIQWTQGTKNYNPIKAENFPGKVRLATLISLLNLLRFKSQIMS